MCFFVKDTATTGIYTLSLHGALSISTEEPEPRQHKAGTGAKLGRAGRGRGGHSDDPCGDSEQRDDAQAVHSGVSPAVGRGPSLVVSAEDKGS